MLPQLPENISNEIFHILTKDDNAALIDGVVAMHELKEEQVYPLSAVIGHAMMGTILLTKLPEHLAEELDLKEEKAKAVALSIIKDVLYPFWPLFPGIDEAIKELGGEAPKEKPAMPRVSNEQQVTSNEGVEDDVVYPTIVPQATSTEPELLGGIEIPVPPSPRDAFARYKIQDTRYAAGDRDAPWTPDRSKTVAKPNDVAKLLEKNLIQDKD